MENRKIIVIAVLLLLSFVNFYVLNVSEPIKLMSFFKIFVVGFLFSRLLFLLIDKFKTS